MQTNLHINKKFEILKNKEKKIAFKTSPRKQINNLDSLPHYDRSLVDYEKYHQYIGHAGVKYSVAVQATRGCPYRCFYCDVYKTTLHHFKRYESNTPMDLSNIMLAIRPQEKLFRQYHTIEQ